MSTASDRQDKGLFRKVLGTLNEAQRRWLVGREALRLGRGGIQRMVEESGLSQPTILKGIGELRGKGNLAAEEGRVRKSGGGRKPIEEGDPDFTRMLEQVMDESTVGDPMSPLKWSSKSTVPDPAIHGKPGSCSQRRHHPAAAPESRLLAAGEPEGQRGGIPRRPGPAVSLH